MSKVVVQPNQACEILEPKIYNEDNVKAWKVFP